MAAKATGSDSERPWRERQKQAAELAAANRRLEALKGAAEALVGVLDLAQVQDTIVAQAIAILQADAAALFVPHEAQDVYEIRAPCGLAASYGSRAHVATADVQAVAARAAGPVCFFSVGQRLPRWARRLLNAGRSTSLAALPLQHGGRSVGLLALLSRAEDAWAALGWQQLAAGYGRLAAAALLGATLHRETEFGAAESTFLLQIGQLLTSTLDAAGIVQMVAEEAADLMESDVCALYLYDPLADAIELRAVHGAAQSRAADAGLQQIPLSRLPAARRAAAKGQPAAGEWPGEGDLLSHFGPAFKLQASLTIPLRAGGSLLGYLFLGRRAPRRFGVQESQSALKLGTLTALALDNARLYADLGAQMQQLRAAQAQLIEAEKMVSLGRIVAGVAHALNNPLAVISGYAQVLLDSDVAPEMRTELERIDRGARRAAQIVRELLAFARQQPIVPSTIDIESLVRDVLERHDAALREAGIEPQVEIEQGLPHIRGDRLQLEQVLGQLIANARRAIAARPGAGKLTVGARFRERVQLAVTDDGSGIPTDLLDKVFEPFLTTQEVGQGMGLGLSMCYGVVCAHGGRIWAANNPTVGASFYVELPAADSPETAPTSDAGSAA